MASVSQLWLERMKETQLLFTSNQVTLDEEITLVRIRPLCLIFNSSHGSFNVLFFGFFLNDSHNYPLVPFLDFYS